MAVQEASVELEAAVVRISLPHTQHQVCVASFAVGSPCRVDFAAGQSKPVPTVLLGGPTPHLMHDSDYTQPASRSPGPPFFLVDWLPLSCMQIGMQHQPIRACAQRPSWFAGSPVHAWRVSYNAGQSKPVPPDLLCWLAIRTAIQLAVHLMHADCNTKPGAGSS